MIEVISVIGGLAGIMIIFWTFSNRHTSKLLEIALSKHNSCENSHTNLVKLAELRLYEARIFEKLEEMKNELVNLREELHIFKEKITTKFDL